MIINEEQAAIWGLPDILLEAARPCLGKSMRMEAYRVLQFCVRGALEEEYGRDQADKILRRAGEYAGQLFYKQFCQTAETMPELVQILEKRFVEYGMGIFRMEAFDEVTSAFSFVMTEDLDCSATPNVGATVCIYSEGFIQGVLESFAGRSFVVEETDCWGTGAKLCRFFVKVLANDHHENP